MMLPAGYSGFTLGAKKKTCEKTKRDYFIPYISITCQGDDYIFLLEGLSLPTEQHAKHFSEVIAEVLGRSILSGSVLRAEDHIPSGEVKQ